MTPQSNILFGHLPNVKRYMTDVFEKNPTLPKYHYKWNVSSLLNYFLKYASDSQYKFGRLA